MAARAAANEMLYTQKDLRGQAGSPEIFIYIKLFLIRQN